jgi:hypothetical protein
MKPLTSQRVRSLVGNIVLALTSAVTDRTKAIDENGVSGVTRAEGSAPSAERRDARGPLRNHTSPDAAGAAMGRQRPGPSRYWPNPSSTEGGRPWPPALPRWW